MQNVKVTSEMEQITVQDNTNEVDTELRCLSWTAQVDIHLESQMLIDNDLGCGETGTEASKSGDSVLRDLGCRETDKNASSKPDDSDTPSMPDGGCELSVELDNCSLVQEETVVDGEETYSPAAMQDTVLNGTGPPAMQDNVFHGKEDEPVPSIKTGPPPAMQATVLLDGKEDETIPPLMSSTPEIFQTGNTRGQTESPADRAKDTTCTSNDSARYTLQQVNQRTLSSPIKSKLTENNLSPEKESVSFLFRVPSTHAISNPQCRIKLYLLPQKKTSTVSTTSATQSTPSSPSVPMWRRIIETLDCTRMVANFRNSERELCNEENNDNVNDVRQIPDKTTTDLDTPDGQPDTESECDHPHYLEMTDYAGAFLNDEGGRLSIQNSDVSLFVPQGALPPGESQLVELKLQQSKRTPSLTETEAWLTPTVKCGPSGLQFKKDVFLVMPHCASHISKWDLSHHSNRTGEWSKSDDEDCVVLQPSQQSSLTLVVLMDSLCEQKVSGCLGEHSELQTKVMTVSVHLDKGKGKERKLRICLTNACEKIIVKSNSTSSPTTEQASDQFHCHYSASRDFMSDSRFRDLCSLLDYLERGNQGWTQVAEALKVDLEPSEVDAVKNQKQKSGTAIFLNAYFERRLEDETDVMDTLAAIGEACKVLSSAQPKSIIDEEISEKESVQPYDTECLGTSQIRISDCREDIWVTVSDENEDDDIAEETDKMILFDKVWAAGDGEEISVSFDVSTDDVSAAIRIQQADDEDNGLLMSVIMPTKKPPKRSKKTSTIIPIPEYDEDDVLSIESDDLSIVASSADLLEELEISEKDRLSFELRAKRRGQLSKDVAKDLYEALKGHEPYVVDSSSEEELSSSDFESSSDDEGISTDSIDTHGTEDESETGESIAEVGIPHVGEEQSRCSNHGSIDTYNTKEISETGKGIAEVDILHGTEEESKTDEGIGRYWKVLEEDEEEGIAEMGIPLVGEEESRFSRNVTSNANVAELSPSDFGSEFSIGRGKGQETFNPRSSVRELIANIERRGEEETHSSNKASMSMNASVEVLSLCKLESIDDVDNITPNGPNTESLGTPCENQEALEPEENDHVMETVAVDDETPLKNIEPIYVEIVSAEGISEFKEAADTHENKEVPETAEIRQDISQKNKARTNASAFELQLSQMTDGEGKESKTCDVRKVTTTGEDKSKMCVFVPDGNSIHDEQKNKSSVVDESSKETQENNTDWTINPFGFITWITAKFKRGKDCPKEHDVSNNNDAALSQSLAACSSGEDTQLSLKENKATCVLDIHKGIHEMTEIEVILNGCAHASQQEFVRTNSVSVDSDYGSNSSRHSSTNDADENMTVVLDDIDGELLARKLSLPGTIPESDV